MKFSTLIALVGYTSAIRLTGPNGTIAEVNTPKVPFVPLTPAGPSAAPLFPSLAQGPNGTIHVDGTFDPPAVAAAPAPPAAAPVVDDGFNIHPGTTLNGYGTASFAGLAQQPAQGPNGTIHVDGTFDPPAVAAAPAAPAAAPVVDDGFNIHPGTTLNGYGTASFAGLAQKAAKGPNGTIAEVNTPKVPFVPLTPAAPAGPV
jgi:hypothetical protein